MRCKAVFFRLSVMAFLWLSFTGLSDALDAMPIGQASGPQGSAESRAADAGAAGPEQDEVSRCLAEAGRGENLDRVLERAARAGVPSGLLMKVLDELQADAADSTERERHVALRLCALTAAEKEIRALGIPDDRKRQQIRARYLAQVEGRYCRFSWKRDAPSYEHRVSLTAKEAQDVAQGGALLDEYAGRLQRFLANLKLDEDTAEAGKESPPPEAPQLDGSRLPPAAYKARRAFAALPESDRQRIRKSLIARARGGFACEGGGCRSDLCRVTIRILEEDALEKTEEGIVSVFRLRPEPACVCSSPSGASP